MGEWRFGFDPKLCANSPWLSNSGDANPGEWFLGGMDGNVVSSVQWGLEGNFLCARVSDANSARLFIPCDIPVIGKTLLFTGSLMQRSQPYNLLIELARGKIGHLRNQSSQWRLHHMRIPDMFDELLGEAHRLFSQGVQCQTDYEESGELALKSLHSAQLASEVLMNSFVKQRLVLQRKRSDQPDISWSCGWGQMLPKPEEADVIEDLFDEIRLPFSWKLMGLQSAKDLLEAYKPMMDWCRQEELAVSAGPLIDFSDNGMPDDLLRWEQDILSLQSIMCDYIESTVSQFASRIRKWEVVSSADKGALQWQWSFLTEEIRLKLAMRALEVVSHIDPSLELSVRVVDPWGEYKNHRKHQINPLQFVDILTRSRAEISTINLQVTRGFETGNTPPFDELELSRELDLWGRLGIPIQITLATPSQPGRCIQAATQPQEGLTEAELSEAKQTQWLERILPVLTAKDCVSGINFVHLSDQVPHEFAYAGLFNEQGLAKEAVKRIGRYRDYDWLGDL